MKKVNAVIEFFVLTNKTKALANFCQYQVPSIGSSPMRYVVKKLLMIEVFTTADQVSL